MRLIVVAKGEDEEVELPGDVTDGAEALFAGDVTVFFDNSLMEIEITGVGEIHTVLPQILPALGFVPRRHVFL